MINKAFLFNESGFAEPIDLSAIAKQKNIVWVQLSHSSAKSIIEKVLSAPSAVAHFLLLQVIMLPYVCRSVFEAVIGAASSASWHVRQRALNFIQVHSFLCPASSSFAPTNTLAHSLTSLT